MKLRSLTLLALVAFPVFAQKPDLEALVRQALPLCPAEVKLTQEALGRELPAGFVGKVFKAESELPSCAGAYLGILTPRGSFYQGSPWFLDGVAGTPAERIRQFALDQLHESFKANVGAQKNEDGLLPVELLYTTEFGKVPMKGWVDPAGTVFFPGTFYPAGADITRVRLNHLSPIVSSAPSRGSAEAPVTLIEFSDFQCPSCKTSAAYVKLLLEKYGSQVRYVRIDYPLVSAHPWAFGAAVIGRAIYQQSPEAFWKYKDAVYENQASLNLFTLEDFARGFVADHDLNVETFNSAIASEAARNQILDSIAAGYSLQIFGTPTFLVNGTLVYAGGEGKNLDAVIAQALTK